MSSSGGFMAFEINSWVHNYYAICQGVVYSDVVSAGGHCWRLACYPHGDPNHVPEPYRFISIYLELVSKPPSHEAGSFTATFTAFAAHGDGAPPSHHAQCGHVYTRDSHGLKRSCGFPEFIPDYIDHIESGLTVMWRVRVTRDNPDGPKIGRQLGRLLDPRLAAWTDVSFVVAGETFRAHRALLAARSPVFEAQLFGAMMESSSSSITLQDVEPETFGAMLQFIYTDSLPNDSSSPNMEALRRLLAAADRFAVDGLKLECARRLLDGVSMGTVVDMLRWADTYNCAELREECVDFVAADRNFNEVVLTVGFMQLVLESPSILEDVRESVARQQHAKESLDDSDDESRARNSEKNSALKRRYSAF